MRRCTLLGGLGLIIAVSGLAVAATPSPELQIQVTDQRGLPVRDAVVEVVVPGGAPGTIRFPWRMAVAQRNQQFVPGTLVVPKGSTVVFPNLDNVRHSIYSFSRIARFNIELYGRDQTRSQRFEVAGTAALGCSIHDEMRGYIRVVETPHAGKTDGSGRIALTGVPAGAARLVVWHPQLRAPGNEMAKALTVSGGGQLHKIAVQLR